MDNRIIHAGVIGAGAISDIYLQNLGSMFSNVKVTEISAAHLDHAEIKAEKYGIKAVTTKEMLADQQIEAVIILTPVGTHYQLIRQALEAGKHVYTEKTIAASLKEARELCYIADEKGLYLGSAPDTFLGSAIQTARHALDEGIIGEVHSFSIAINRDNDLLTSMFPFLRQPGAGALRDYLVYYLTSLVYLSGPVKRICSLQKTPYKTRNGTIPDKPDYHQEIKTPNESIISAVVEMKNGMIGTIHEDNESAAVDRADFVIYGRKGMLLLDNCNNFGGKIRYVKTMPSEWNNPDEPEILSSTGIYSENARGLGMSEMASSIFAGRKNRASKELAYHVLEIIEAMERSNISGRFEEIHSSFDRGLPLTGRAEE